MEAGFSHITRLCSDMSGVRRVTCYRAAGTVESALLLDEVMVEAIGDGKHVPHSLVELTYKCKGSDGMALFSDVLAAPSMLKGIYSAGGIEDRKVIVEEGVAWLSAKFSFAGSVVTGSHLITTMVEIAETPLQEAVKMVTTTSARVLRISAKMGSLAEGKYADVAAPREGSLVFHTIVGGNMVYDASSQERELCSNQNDHLWWMN